MGRRSVTSVNRTPHSLCIHILNDEDGISIVRSASRTGLRDSLQKKSANITLEASLVGHLTISHISLYMS